MRRSARRRGGTNHSTQPGRYQPERFLPSCAIHGQNRVRRRRQIERAVHHHGVPVVPADKPADMADLR